jgi:hypothetical protein
MLNLRTEVGAPGVWDVYGEQAIRSGRPPTGAPCSRLNLSESSRAC